MTTVKQGWKRIFECVQCHWRYYYNGGVGALSEHACPHCLCQNLIDIGPAR